MMSEVATTRRAREPKLIREPQLAARIDEAADKHPHMPAKNFGRLEWLREEFAKHGITISNETARKWLAGEARPYPDKMLILAMVLGVDVSWLERGIDKNITPKERRARQSATDGSVNLVAGLIQMDGGNVLLPEEGDEYARNNYVDLYATIKGTRYPLHVSLGESSGETVKFGIPKNLDNVIVVGIVRDGFSIQLFEITDATVKTHGRGTGVKTTSLKVQLSDLKPISGFTTRL